MTTSIRRPYFWSRMKWRERAAYLLSSNQARSFGEACSILASQRRRTRVYSVPVVARLPYKDAPDGEE